MYCSSWEKRAKLMGRLRQYNLKYEWKMVALSLYGTVEKPYLRALRSKHGGQTNEQKAVNSLHASHEIWQTEIGMIEYEEGTNENETGKQFKQCGV